MTSAAGGWTVRGREILTQIEESAHAHERRTDYILGPDDRAEILRILKTLVARLNKSAC
jgi:DNA-binding MarR family transcriptional regulator